MSNRNINTDIWKDKKYKRELDTIESRYLFIYLLSCPDSNACGIFHITMDQIKQDTRLSDEQLELSFEKIVNCGICEYNYDTEEIIIYNYPKYNIRTWGKPMEEMLERGLAQVDDTKLIAKMYVYLSMYINRKTNDKQLVKMLNYIMPFYLNALPEKEKRDIERYDLTNTNTNTITNTNTESHTESVTESLNKEEIESKWNSILESIGSEN